MSQITLYTKISNRDAVINGDGKTGEQSIDFDLSLLNDSQRKKLASLMTTDCRIPLSKATQEAVVEFVDLKIKEARARAEKEAEYEVQRKLLADRELKERELKVRELLNTNAAELALTEVDWPTDDRLDALKAKVEELREANKPRPTRPTGMALVLELESQIQDRVKEITDRIERIWDREFAIDDQFQFADEQIQYRDEDGDWQCSYESCPVDVAETIIERASEWEALAEKKLASWVDYLMNLLA